MAQTPGGKRIEARNRQQRAERAARKAEKEAARKRAREERRARQTQESRWRKAAKQRRDEAKKREKEERKKNGSPVKDAAQERLKRIREDIRRRREATRRRVQELKRQNGTLSFWQNRFGCTEEQWQRTALCAHEVALPVYLFDAPVAGATEPDQMWPTVFDSHPLLTLHDDGSVDGRIAGTGPGSRIDQPAWSRPWHALYDLWSSTWRAAEFARIVLAGKNAAGTVIDGRIGWGSRALKSPFAARGWDSKLTYAGAGGVDNPDLEFVSKDPDGSENPSSGAVLKINGVAIGASRPKQSAYTLNASEPAVDASAVFPLGTLMVVSDADANEIQGIEAPDFGDFAGDETVRVRLFNAGTDDFILIDESGSAAAGDEIDSVLGDITVAPGENAEVEYDRTASMWRLV